MLSFFIKKKQTVDAAEEIIQGPSASTSNEGVDDFIFVEKKNHVDPAPVNPKYPPLPSGFNSSLYPGQPYPPQGSPTAAMNANQTAVPYVQDVPFVLAPQLLIKNTSDLTQTQVDGILALLTRQLSVDEIEEYNFALEKSIQKECY